MSEGQWIESGTLDLWESRHREQLARIEELEAKLAAEREKAFREGFGMAASLTPHVYEVMEREDEAWQNSRTRAATQETPHD